MEDESTTIDLPPKEKRQNRSYLRKTRYVFQWGLFLFIVYGGYRFYLFTEHFVTPGVPYSKRPPMVEGFLPIGSLMTLKLWLTEGIFDPVHPAGITIFAAALLMSALLKKSFCGWICPVGALSELLYKVGARIFGRNFTIHRWIDLPLRSLKYLLMSFFLYIVLFKMSTAAVRGFLSTPYWMVADVKMLHFFTMMTKTTAVSLVVLGVLSLLFRNFWCRYLCPYGAVVGLLSYLSPLKVTRNEEACIHCRRCSRHCPSQINVEKSTRVRSPECTGCLTCVSRCPVKGALDVAAPRMKPAHPALFIVLALALFFGAIATAKLTGSWHSSVTYEQYRALVPKVTRFTHP
jgi:polyferredoxin